MNASTEKWAAQIRADDVRAVSRAITANENGETEARDLLRELFPSTGKAWRIGITGSGGVGKSTLVNCLVSHYRKQEKTVGIIAVDPSSSFTGGALLGDRIRMQEHSTDEGVFIRSMASRGASGGLAQAAADAALILDAAGRDVILIETVGVGQDEIDVASVADCTLVVVVPGSGDEVQSLKAGLMEIADIFVLNKSDDKDSERFEQQLEFALQLAPRREGWNPVIVKTVATETMGIEDLARQIGAFRAAHAAEGDRRAREVEYWRNRLTQIIQQRVAAFIVGDRSARLEAAALAVASRKKDPFAAADEMLASLGLKQK